MNYSAMSDLFACPRMFQLIHEEKLRSPQEDGPASREYGSLWHKIMEYYNANPLLESAECVALACENLGWSDPNDYRNRSKALRGLDLWKQRYAGQHWVVTEPELRFEVDFGIGAEKATGRYDAVVEAVEPEGDGRVEKWIVDYKTTGKMAMDWLTQYRISNQFKMYYAARGLLKGDDIAGVLVDGYRVTTGNKSANNEYEKEGHVFYRGYLRFSGDDLDEMYQDYTCAVLMRDTFRGAGYFPKNTGNCWRCSFTDICETKDPDLREALKEAYKV